ncbi:MAG: phosphate ABC transporter ATP-binding protein [Candidatus Omnitrophica bacterium]|nr:phosphate ABC transporter ATP-binding protein [Candidatus Omnitrophota bacterium]
MPRSETKVKFSLHDVNIRYKTIRAVKDLSLNIYEHEILSVIGPANSGKSSFLRCLNRLNDFEAYYHQTGQICLEGKDIYRQISAEDLRKRVGMIFALPIPLPLTIRENVLYGPRRAGMSRRNFEQIVEDSLTAASLWDEVKDRLDTLGTKLSGGQQQRLCIARMLALQPEVILFDEPCSGLDPISTARVEETMLELKEKHTIVLVTNNTKQAARVGSRTAFFLMGELVEVGDTGGIFTAPRDQRTNDYITGRFG